MKQRIKILSGLLAMLLATSAFAACEGNQNEPETNTVTDTEKETMESTTEEITNCDTEGEPESESEQETMQTHAHTYGDWTTVTEATCDTEGMKERVCACGEKETQPIAAGCVPDDNGICGLCGQEVDWADFLFELNGEETGYIVYRYMGNRYQVTIPAVYRGLPVTEISSAAFSRSPSVISVTIPSSVTSIDPEAFGNCPRVAEIINHSAVRVTWFPYALEEHRGDKSKIINVDDLLFYSYGGETYLIGYIGTDADLILPESVNGNSYKIKNNAFGMAKSSNSRLKSILISSGVTEIGQQAFYGCTGLTSITIPDSVTQIGAQAFQQCTNLTNVTISDGVTKIGKYAFDGCENLVSVTFENTSGWKARTAKGGLIDILAEGLSDPSVAATYLTSTYSGYLWEQN